MGRAAQNEHGRFGFLRRRVGALAVASRRRRLRLPQGQSLLGGLKNKPLVFRGKAGLLAVAPGEDQGREKHLVVNVFRPVPPHVLGYHMRRLFLIFGQEALVVADVRLQRRLIAQQQGEEVEPGDVLAQHDQADR